ncbi:PREDICTED: E3 ubiquitin-ligase [Prunus dulcis]|uniref:RING-type E3 ubiquitin transferase n=1 Tax=Prunus dulcis TaxID=3755 RepID=A0A5E4FRN7_PRUDU|nr:E3 ubiquitin-protein ligase SINA-like 10 [Prunus dulcis]VVA30123.1 PREDICTED: E3 ubiquitin-ligase [Prunus dulcis]
MASYSSSNDEPRVFSRSGTLKRARRIPNEQDGSHSHIVVTLTDPEVFDCPICFEPLTIPVYQCDQNGHIACSSCCTKINNRCPSCSGSIGCCRCRAIEKALETITISCQNIQYGCKESVAYHKKGEHQKACVYSPCSCPLLYCNFVSSAEQLYKHFSSRHVSSATQFRFGNSVPVSLNASDDFLVLQEKNKGTLFILKNHHVEHLGNAVTISCIQPSFMRRYLYDLDVKAKGNSLSSEFFTLSIPSRQVIDDSPPTTWCLLIPSGFISPGDQLKMQFCIWPKDAVTS